MQATEQQQPAFKFGVFEMNPHTRELRKNGVKVKLQDQPLQILLLLLEHPAEIVTREEIQRRLWPENTYVDFDNAINSSVRKLREALGDSPENPRFVETLARRGYRFIAPVSRAASPPFRGEPSRFPSQHVQFPVISSRPTAQKRRLVLIACTLAVLFAAAGMTIRWWTSKSKEAGLETPLPAVPLTGNRGYEEFPTFSPEGTRGRLCLERTRQATPQYLRQADRARRCDSLDDGRRGRFRARLVAGWPLDRFLAYAPTLSRCRNDNPFAWWARTGSR